MAEPIHYRTIVEPGRAIRAGDLTATDIAMPTADMGPVEWVCGNRIPTAVE